MESWLREKTGQWLNELKGNKGKLEDEIRESEREAYFQRIKANMALEAQKGKSQAKKKELEDFFAFYEKEAEKAEEHYENVKEENKKQIERISLLIEQAENYLR